MLQKLSNTQNEVLEAIVSFIKKNEYCPSVRDVCALMNYSSPSTAYVHINTLIEKGYLNKQSQCSRSITLTQEYREALGEALAVTPVNVDSSETTQDALSYSLVEVPLVGDVAAGIPILAEQNITSVLPLPKEIVGESASFVLKVKGESMIDAGILSGDYVVVREQHTANNGEIVVALVENESATVKRFYKEDDYIRLQPENSTMDPIITRDCSIEGKVVAVIRKVR